MKDILLLGAGKTTPYLIEYLANLTRTIGELSFCIADKNLESAQTYLQRFPNIKAIALDISNPIARKEAIERAQVVISLLPIALHLPVAETCAAVGTHMLTASYVKPELAKLSHAFANKNKLLIMEMGLDPGIDHMIAMKILQTVKKQGHKIHSFEAFTGALLDGDPDTNPWNYKFTWNPLQITSAGQEGAQFLHENKLKFIPHHQVFRRIERISIAGHGYFEGYANRDSISYIDTYHLHDVPTVYRGTLRPEGFCAAWNLLVRIGATDANYRISGLKHMTHKDFINIFLIYHPTDSVKLKFAHYMRVDLHTQLMDKLQWLGIFDTTPIDFPRDEATALEVLTHISSKKVDPPSG